MGDDLSSPPIAADLITAFFGKGGLSLFFYESHFDLYLEQKPNAGKGEIYGLPTKWWDPIINSYQI